MNLQQFSNCCDGHILQMQEKYTLAAFSAQCVARTTRYRDIPALEEMVNFDKKSTGWKMAKHMTKKEIAETKVRLKNITTFFDEHPHPDIITENK